MTRRRLLRELDSREIVEWDAFFELENQNQERLTKQATLEREALADLRRK